jgi:NAD(P)-dependent dehydrogenase (short-subunit alcohol dehydrogenase family)
MRNVPLKRGVATIRVQRVTARLEGRLAVVVGVGSTIGRASAARLAVDGAVVLAVDGDAGVAASVAEEIGPPTTAHAAELATTRGAESTARRCRQMGEALDVLVHCGSAMEVWPEDQDTIESLLEVLTNNVAGPIAYTIALQPLLAASPAASVVYLGSIDGIRGNPHVPGYSLGKGALLTLTHMMATRLGPDRIRVNCVAAAGIMQTGSGVAPLDRVTGVTDLALRLTPLGRMPAPEEVASVTAFFASDDASYVTGTVLPVDGGRTAPTPGTW